MSNSPVRLQQYFSAYEARVEKGQAKTHSLHSVHYEIKMNNIVFFLKNLRHLGPK